METDQDNGTNISNTGAEGKATERTQKQSKDTHENKMESSVTPAKKEEILDSSVTPAKQDGGTDANGKPTDFTTNQGDDTPVNILSADAASNKDTDQGAEEETSEQIQKQEEILDSSVTPAKQERDTVANGEATKITPHQSEDTQTEKTSVERTLKQTTDTHETEKESSATPAKEDGNTDAKGEPIKLTPNQRDGTLDNKLTADAASKDDSDTGAEGEYTERTQKQAKDTHDTEKESSATPAKEDGDTGAKGEPIKLTPNQRDTTDTKLIAEVASNEDKDAIAEGISAERPSKQAGGTDANGKPSEFTPTQGDGTPDKTLTAGATSNKDTGPGADEDTTDKIQTQGERLDFSVAPAKQEGDTVANGEPTKITPSQGADTATENTFVEKTPKQAGDTDAKGEPTKLTPNRGDGTSDNKLTADAASNEDEVAKGEPTEFTPNQGDGTKDNKLIAEAVEDDDAITEGISAEKTSKQAGDKGTKGTPTDLKPNQGDGSPDNKCTTDAASNEARIEKRGEPTGPTLSKGDNDSKSFGKSLKSDDANHDANQSIQTMDLLTEIEQLKLKLEVTEKDRDDKGKGIKEFCEKDIASQRKIFELQEKLEALKNVNQRENNEYEKRDLKNESYKTLLHERIKKMEKEKNQQQDKITKQKVKITEQIEELKKQKEEIKNLKGHLKQIETLKQKNENASESKIKALTGKIEVLNAHIRETECKYNTEIKHLKRDNQVEQQNLMSLSRQYNEVIQRLQTTQGEVLSLTEDKKELLLRLSKVAGANLTYNNPNIADLSDDKRPTKLAEEFSELYDNEWTDVFEELDFKTENEKTNFMIDILMKINAICSGLSNDHTKRIKTAFCSLTTTCHIMKRSTVDKKEVVMTDLQKEAKVASLDKDMVKEGKNEKNETHGDDEQIDSRRAVDFKDKLEHETTEVLEQDTTDSTTVTESREKNGQSEENDLKIAAEAQHDGTDNGNEEMIIGKAELSKDKSTKGHVDTVNAERNESMANQNKNDEDEITADHLRTINANKKESKADKDHIDEIPKVKHDSIERKNEENEEGKAEPPKDESTAGYSNPVNADQNKSMANQDKNDEIPEAKHDSKDKGHADNKEDKAEPPKKSKLEQDNMDKNPEENKDDTEVDTIAPEAQHGGTDKETEEKIGREILPPKKLELQHDNTDKPPEQNKEENQVETPGSPNDKSENDALEAPEATNSPMDVVTERETEISIESDFELLQKEQKKTIMDAKNFFENQLAKEVETTVADIIGKEFQTDTEKTCLMAYITKCVNICWSMCRHNPPVFIEFPDVKESTPFDTNKYKPYTSSGKFIDYIVWPALYLHEDGPLLGKGVAQGLGNKKMK